MRLHLPSLVLATLLAACRTASVSPEPATASPELDRVSRIVAGNWDWARGDSTCLGNTHTIEFARDDAEMVLTFRQPIDTATGQRVARYRVLQAGSNVLPDLPVVVRAAMEGETRQTDGGQLVVWDLIMATPNRYHWHRTDWPNVGITGAIVRCDGATPLEHWQPPTSGSTGA